MIARFALAVTAACARHPRIVLAAALLAVLGGEVARRSLPGDLLPDLATPQVVLAATWPGRGASEVDAAVTQPLAAALADVAHATAVRGFSMTGLGYLDVVLDARADLAAARAAVQARLAQARLPRGARVRVGPAATSTGWVLEYALTSQAGREAVHGDDSAGPSLATLRRLQEETLGPALAALPGVAEVAGLGGELDELLVAVKPEALRAAGLALSDVAGAIEGRLASGRLTPEGLGQLPVAAGGTRPRPLEELAHVRRVRAMAEGAADLDGASPVVGGIVVARPGADVQEVSRRVRAALANARLPTGAGVVVVHDRAPLAAGVGRTFLRALGEELAVVVLVVLGFLLHGRSALVPLGTLLVVLALTFLVMAALGVPATVMSLGGIGIALGLAVDADLVALEACHRRLESGAAGERRAGLVAAAGVFAPAVLTSLLIAALAFLPAFAFGGETGRLLRPLVLTKTVVVAAAALVALTVGPALRDRLLGGRIVPELGNPLTRALVRGYRPLVLFALERPAFTLVTAALALGSCLPLAPRLGGELLPRIDEGDLLYMPTTASDVPPELAAAELELQDQALRRRPEVALVFGKVGRADSATDPAPCSMAETLVHLRPPEAWPSRRRPRWYSGWAPPWLAAVLRPLWPEETRPTTAELIDDLDRAVRRPGWAGAWTAPVRARMDMMTTGVRTPVGVRLLAPDRRRLEALAAALTPVLAAVPGARAVIREGLGTETRLRFELDAAAAAAAQVEAAPARALAELLLTGGELGELEAGGRRLRVRLAPDVGPRPREELLREATVRASGGGPPVALGLVGHPTFAGEPALVRSERGQQAAYIYVDLADASDPAGYVVRARRAIGDAIAAGGLEVRPDERVEWTGEFELLAAGQRRLALLAPLVVAAVLALLWLQLRSVAETLIVFCAVPFALVGSVWTLFLLDYRLSAPVWLGLLSVVGLATQTGVVMVVYIDEAFFRRVREGRLQTPADVVAAHAEGTIRRLRPKLMTVTTMAAALLPLLWAEGPGAEVAKRVAAPMLGGLGSSAFLTLEVLPVLYTLWRQHQLRAAGRSGRPVSAIMGRAPGWSRGAAGSGTVAGP